MGCLRAKNVHEKSPASGRWSGSVTSASSVITQSSRREGGLGMNSWVGPKGFVVISFIPVDFFSREYLSYAHPWLPPVVHSPQLTLPFTYVYESSPPQFPWASPSWKETYKREASGVNCSPCYYSWSRNPVQFSSPPSSTIHSRLPSPSANSSEGLGDLLCCDPNPHSRVVQGGLSLRESYSTQTI